MDILIVKPKWAELILSGKKTLEIRGSNTNKRGIIGIAESGSGKVFGEIELIWSSPLCFRDFIFNFDKHLVECTWKELHEIYKTPYIWQFRNAKRYAEPRQYKHPRGAVIWVRGE